MRFSDWSSDVCSSDLASRSFALCRRKERCWQAIGARGRVGFGEARIRPPANRRLVRPKQAHNGAAERLVVSRVPRQDFLNPDPDSLGAVAKERGAHYRPSRITGESKFSKT